MYAKKKSINTVEILTMHNTGPTLWSCIMGSYASPNCDVKGRIFPHYPIPANHQVSSDTGNKNKYVRPKTCPQNHSLCGNFLI